MRAFIAVEVPESIKDKIETISNKFNIRGISVVKRDAIHITLQFLGEINATDVEKVKGAMDNIDTSPFHLGLKGLSYFSPSSLRVVFIRISDGNEELKHLYETLSSGIIANQILYQKEEYTPHLTIGRVKETANRGEMLSIIEKYTGYDFGSFNVDHIKLKKSVLESNGPVYSDLYEVKF